MFMKISLIFESPVSTVSDIKYDFYKQLYFKIIIIKNKRATK